MRIENKCIKAIIIGHAIADALGVPVEFKSRDELTRNPVVGMREYGTYHQPMGVWSDDTSMSLCALQVLADGKYDFDKVMQNFNDWYTNGYFTATGHVFDVGITCQQAINKYGVLGYKYINCGIEDEYSNGNGSLMRIHPFVLYLVGNGKSVSENIDIIFMASALTHAHERSKIACGIYAFVLEELIKNPCVDSITKGLFRAKAHLGEYKEFSSYKRIFDTGFDKLNVNQIKSSGYVVHTLEAALWCLLNTNSYKECVLKAVNLGGDTDTVGAIAGSLAGALYGYDDIPDEWLDILKRREYIEYMCDKAYNTWNKREALHKICDTHMHIVYGVDDGAEDLDMSVEMLKIAYQQGVRTVFCTSHNMNYSIYMNKYMRNYNKLCEIVKKVMPDLRLITGNEIYCNINNVFENIKALSEGTTLSLGETNYVLVEYSPLESPQNIDKTTTEFINNGYIPIIAHAERCVNILSIVHKLIEKGCLIQVNAYSFVDETDNNIKNRAKIMLKERQISFIGSDAHTIYHRAPNVKSGVTYIYENTDQEYADSICFANVEKYLNK